MEFENYFPVWNKLNQEQQRRICGSLTTRHVEKGSVIHNGNMDCTGLLLVKSGQLRAYILSEEGREISHLPSVRTGYVSVLCLLHHALYSVRNHD